MFFLTLCLLFTTEKSFDGAVPDSFGSIEGFLVECRGVGVDHFDAGSRQDVVELVQEDLPPCRLKISQGTVVQVEKENKMVELP